MIKLIDFADNKALEKTTTCKPMFLGADIVKTISNSHLYSYIVIDLRK